MKISFCSPFFLLFLLLVVLLSHFQANNRVSAIHIQSNLQWTISPRLIPRKSQQHLQQYCLSTSIPCFDTSIASSIYPHLFPIHFHFVNPKVKVAIVDLHHHVLGHWHELYEKKRLVKGGLQYEWLRALHTVQSARQHTASRKHDATNKEIENLKQGATQALTDQLTNNQVKRLTEQKSLLRDYRPPTLIHIDSHDDMEIQRAKIPLLSTQIQSIIESNRIANFISVAQYLDLVGMKENIWFYNRWDLHAVAYDGFHEAVLGSFIKNGEVFIDYATTNRKEPLLKRFYKRMVSGIEEIADQSTGPNSTSVEEPSGVHRHHRHHGKHAKTSMPLPKKRTDLPPKGPISWNVKNLFNDEFTDTLSFETPSKKQPYILDIDLDFFALDDSDLYNLLDVRDVELRRLFATLRQLTSGPGMICGSPYRLQELLHYLVREPFDRIDTRLVGTPDLLWCHNGLENLESVRIVLMRIFHRIGYVSAAALIDEYDFPLVNRTLNQFYGLRPTEHTRCQVTEDQIQTEMNKLKSLIENNFGQPELVTIARSSIEFTPTRYLKLIESSLLRVLGESFPSPIDVTYHENIPHTNELDTFYSDIDYTVEPLSNVREGLSSFEMIQVKEEFGRIQEQIELVLEYSKDNDLEMLDIMDGPDEFERFLRWRNEEDSELDAEDLDQVVWERIHTLQKACYWCEYDD